MIDCAHTNCYVLRGIDGDVLIDTGTKKYRHEIEIWLLNYSVRLIVLTSGLNFCIENAAYFKKLYDCPIAMSKKDIPLIKDNLCRNYYITDRFGRIGAYSEEEAKRRKAEEFSPDILLSDGDVLHNLGVSEILSDARIVSLDGCTRGTLGILNGGDLYTGAAFSNVGKGFWCSAAESPRAEKNSLGYIAAMSPERIFPLHGDPVEKGDKTYLKFMKKFSD